MSERDKESEIGTDGWGGQAGGWVVCVWGGGGVRAGLMAGTERERQSGR